MMRNLILSILLLIFWVAPALPEEKSLLRNLAIEDNGQEKITLTLEKEILYSFMQPRKSYSINICFSNSPVSEAAIFYYHRKLILNQKNGCYSFPGLDNNSVLFLTKEKWDIYFAEEINKFRSSININTKTVPSDETNQIPLVWIRNTTNNTFPESIRLGGETDNKMQTTHQIQRKTRKPLNEKISAFVYTNYLFFLGAEFFLVLLLVYFNFRKRKWRQATPQTWNYYTYSLESLHDQVKLKSLSPELKGSIKWKKKGLRVKLKGQKKILLSPEQIKDRYKIVINPAFYLELEPFFQNDPGKKLLKININFFRKENGKPA